jgi:hypothetical protein
MHCLLISLAIEMALRTSGRTYYPHLSLILGDEIFVNLVQSLDTPVWDLSTTQIISRYGHL